MNRRRIRRCSSSSSSDGGIVVGAKKSNNIRTDSEMRRRLGWSLGGGDRNCQMMKLQSSMHPRTDYTSTMVSSGRRSVECRRWWRRRVCTRLEKKRPPPGWKRKRNATTNDDQDDCDCYHPVAVVIDPTAAPWFRSAADALHIVRHFPIL